MNEKRLAEIAEELRAIADEIEAKPEMPAEDLEERNKRVDDLRGEEKRIQARMSLTGKLDGKPETKPEERGGSESEKRGRELLQDRAVTVGSSNLVLPKHYGTDIKPTFNEISSIVDLVDIKVLQGGESYTQAFEKGGAEAGYTAEGADATTAEPTVDYIEINKAKLTAYAEDTEEVKKLPAADYDGMVMNSTRKSIRKKLAREILTGAGTANTLCGIFKAPVKVIPVDSDVTLAKIDENTLDEIIFAYGGDEDVEGEAVLILSKLDLKAFAAVRGTQDKKKVYDIELRGNTGLINKIPFVINSACEPLSVAATAAGKFCMAYGNMKNYTLTVFSDVEVSRSTDQKFKQGMICHRGVAFMGGNVTAWKGFIRVKKSA